MHYAPSTRLSLLPFHLQLLVHARLASTTATTSDAGPSSTSYPFPAHPNPTPHQIFHLPHSASQQEVKARYYDLVRAHHPDAPACRALPPELRHARFQAISSAYDTLRGRTRAQGRAPRYDDAFYAEELERRRRQHRRRAEYWSRYDQPGSAGARVHMHSQVDEGWKDQVIVIVGLAALIVGLAPAFFKISAADARHVTAAQNLAQARRDAREFGQERRNQIHRRVEELKSLHLEAEGDQGDSNGDRGEADAEKVDATPFVGRARR